MVPRQRGAELGVVTVGIAVQRGRADDLGDGVEELRGRRVRRLVRVQAHAHVHLRRVVPLPPPELSGAVKFTTVVLSLAYDNFGEAGAPATIPATVRILRGSGPVQTLNVNIEVGRKFFHFMQADDQAASVQLNPPAGFRPHVTALVEYATP